MHRVQQCVSQGHRCGRRDTSGFLLRTFSRQLSSCQRQVGTRLSWLDPVSRYVLSHCCLLQVQLKALHRSHGWPEGKDKSALRNKFAQLPLSTCSQLCIQFPILSHNCRPVRQRQRKTNLYMAILACSHLFKIAVWPN